MSDTFDPNRLEVETTNEETELEPTEVPLEDVEEEDPADAAFEYLDDDLNIVTSLVQHPRGPAELKRIGEHVCEVYDQARADQQEYRDRLEKNWKLFAGELPDKVWPWKNCANANVPILTENVSRLYLRFAGEIFQDWQTFFSVLPTNATEEARAQAEVLSRHGNWQLMADIPDFARQQLRGLLLFVMGGDVTSQSYYDPWKRRNCHDILTPEDFTVPYAYTSVSPDWSDVPWRARKFDLYRHELQAYRGKWHEVESTLRRDPPSWFAEPEQTIQEGAAQTQGIAPEEDSEDARPYTILMWEGWLQLMDDTSDRFFQIYVDYEKKAVLAIRLHEEPHWKERLRYRRQLEESQQYLTDVETFPQRLQQFQMESQQHEQMTQMAMSAPPPVDPMGNPMPPQLPPPPMPPPPMPPPPPMRPNWADPMQPIPTPVKPETRPIQEFNHAVAIEPLFGNMGLSYGRILGDYNRATNDAFNQYLDAATASNAAMWLGSKMARLPENFQMAPGKIAWCDNTPEELAGVLIPFRAPPPAESMVNAVNMMQSWAQSAANAPEVLSGAPGKSGETRGGLSLRVQQITKLLSVMGHVYARFLTGIVRCNAWLNSIHLPEEEILMLQDPKTKLLLRDAIRRDLYERDYNVTLRADMSFSSKEAKIAEADELVAMTQLPPFQMNPQLAVPFAQRAIQKALEARGADDMIPYLGPDAPPPPVPVGSPPPPPPPGAEAQPQEELPEDAG